MRQLCPAIPKVSSSTEQQADHLYAAPVSQTVRCLSNSARVSCTQCGMGSCWLHSNMPSNKAKRSNSCAWQQHAGASWQHADDGGQGKGSQVQLALPIILGKVHPDVGLHARGGHLHTSSAQVRLSPFFSSSAHKHGTTCAIWVARYCAQAAVCVSRAAICTDPTSGGGRHCTRPSSKHQQAADRAKQQPAEHANVSDLAADGKAGTHLQHPGGRVEAVLQAGHPRDGLKVLNQPATLLAQVTLHSNRS